MASRQLFLTKDDILLFNQFLSDMCIKTPSRNLSNGMPLLIFFSLRLLLVTIHFLKCRLHWFILKVDNFCLFLFQRMTCKPRCTRFIKDYTDDLINE
jgi:hypothetical protein